MGAKGLPIRSDVPAAALRRLARRERDRAAAARMQVIAGALEGLPRAEAARLAGMERQALRDAGRASAGGRGWTRRGGGAAMGYDRSFGHVCRQFIPSLLGIARLAPGQHVLDIATGTGIAAKAAATAVGPLGDVVAGDLSPSMLEGARRRLCNFSNVTLVGEDAHSLTQGDVRFDAVLCHFGIMSFHNPAKALSEFRRVLRPSGRLVMSVTVPDRDYTTPIVAALAARSKTGTDLSKSIPASLGDQARLRERPPISKTSSSSGKHIASSCRLSMLTSPVSSLATATSEGHLRRCPMRNAKPFVRTCCTSWVAMAARLPWTWSSSLPSDAGNLDEWAVQRCYMSLETLAPISDASTASLPVVAT